MSLWVSQAECKRQQLDIIALSLDQPWSKDWSRLAPLRHFLWATTGSAWRPFEGGASLCPDGRSLVPVAPGSPCTNGAWQQLSSCVGHIAPHREPENIRSSVFRSLGLRTGPRDGRSQQHTHKHTLTQGEENRQIFSWARKWSLSLSVFVCLRQHKTSLHIPAVLNYDGGERSTPHLCRASSSACCHGYLHPETIFLIWKNKKQNPKQNALLKLHFYSWAVITSGWSCFCTRSFVMAGELHKALLWRFGVHWNKVFATSRVGALCFNPMLAVFSSDGWSKLFEAQEK